MSLPFNLNPVLERLPVYQPGRPIAEVAREMGLPERSVIKLASNENPLGPSPAALAAMKKACRQVHLYPDGNAFYFKNKLADFLKVNPSNLILGNGSNDIIEFLGHALMGPGDEVVVSEYCFAIYPIVARLLGAEVVTVPAKNYGHDLPAMANAITPKTKVIFVANPNNPTGTLAPSGDVLQLVKETPPEVVLVMDEAYIEFLENPLDLLPLIRSGEKPNLILMRTFSKIYGLAGLRLGYGIAHPEFVAALEKIRQPFNLNSMAQAAGLAALDDFEHVRKTRENNRTGKQFLEEALTGMGLPFVPSSANFVLVQTGEGKRVFEEMQKLGVITRPMGGYQLPEWIRLSIGTPAENRRAVRTLKKVLARLKKAHSSLTLPQKKASSLDNANALTPASPHK
jgi:histidinol-phosphate aminotransferase